MKKQRLQHRFHLLHSTRQSGTVSLFALIVVALLAALAAAHCMLLQKNLQSSAVALCHAELHKYAESGASLAIFDLQYNVSNNRGNIGTALWQPGTDDTGQDGAGGSLDHGEGDGVPTFGEPNVYPVAFGSGLNYRLITHVTDAGYPGVYRVIATCGRGDDFYTVEKYLNRRSAFVPRVGALYVGPQIQVVQGGNFLIDGNDHTVDGRPLRDMPPVYALATGPGDPPGSNRDTLLADIANKDYRRFLGKDGQPSVGEDDSGMDIHTVFDAFKGLRTNTLNPGNYSEFSAANMGTLDQLAITYVGGDLGLGGSISGAGILLVDGNLKMAGESKFRGIVISRGNTTLTGGGSGVHIIGSLLVMDGPYLNLQGTSDVLYSSQMLDLVAAFAGNELGYKPVYTDRSLDYRKPRASNSWTEIDSAGSLESSASYQ
jgi:hypothetical protein